MKKKILTMLQLYSVQVLTILAAVNTFMGTRSDVPWWVVLGFNLLGVIVGLVVREIPQPAVTAKLAALRQH